MQHRQPPDAGVEHTDRAIVGHPAECRPHSGYARSVTTPIRIGTCSWADDALVKHFYPPGTPARERLSYYAERFSTVEVDSTYYRVPTDSMVQGWADRTPAGFVMHVKAFGLMTRHPVKLEQVPPDLREGLPVDDRGRVDRPPPEARARVFDEFLRSLEPLRSTRQARRDPVPAAALHRLEEVLARLSRVGERAARRRPDAGRATPPLLVRRGRARGAPRAGSSRTGWPGSSSTRRRSWRRTSPTRSSPSRHRPRTSASTGGTPAPGTSAEALRRSASTTSTARTSSASWAEPLRELSGAAENAYAFFNNNNQTDGVAQATAGAALLRKLLDEESVPTA